MEAKYKRNHFRKYQAKELPSFFGRQVNEAYLNLQAADKLKLKFLAFKELKRQDIHFPRMTCEFIGVGNMKR